MVEMSEPTKKPRSRTLNRERRRLNQEISAEVHRRLKSHAAERDQNLPEAIEELLRKALGMDPPQQCAPA
jgi:predicted HicB family RNase H-like nuclease